MKKINPILLGLSLAVTCCTVATAQQDTQRHDVLQITREYLKPYKSGMAHDKTESAFIAAETRAKFPVHYVSLNSLSGKSRALFLTRYGSFDEWQKANDLVDHNKELGEAFERAGIADGELLSDVDSMVYNYSNELSYHPHGDLAHARYVEIAVFNVRLGHDADWHKLSKQYRDALDKSSSTAHWAMYQGAYGAPDGTYIAITGDKSLADIDAAMLDGKKLVDTIGEDEWRKIDKLYGECVESAHTELFSINPRQSYPPEEWVAADPAFWKPKHAAEPDAKHAMAEKKAN
ncbi:MAG: hypothetical protein ABSF16_12950 [Terracidiphilus sp.]|jgi:hypothetical protein